MSCTIHLLASGRRLGEIPGRRWPSVSHVEDARAALGAGQPTIAAAMTPAVWRDKATCGYSATFMNRWDLPGVTELPDVGVAPGAMAVEG